jgi:hypothetical protein
MTNDIFLAKHFGLKAATKSNVPPLLTSINNLQLISMIEYDDKVKAKIIWL